MKAILFQNANLTATIEGDSVFFDCPAHSSETQSGIKSYPLSDCCGSMTMSLADSEEAIELYEQMLTDEVLRQFSSILHDLALI